MIDPTLRRLQPWQALRFDPWRDLTLLAFGLMELSWLTPWYLLLSAAVTRAVSLPRAALFFGLVFIAANLLTRWADSQAPQAGRLLWAGLFGLGSWLGFHTLIYAVGGLTIEVILSRLNTSNAQAAFPAEFLIVAAVGWLIYRATLPERHIFGPARLLSEFRLGLIAFLFYGLAALAAGETLRAGLLYVFLFAGLLTLSSGRIATLQYSRSGQRSSFDRTRLFGLLLFVVAIIGLTLATAALFNSDLVYQLFDWLYALVIDGLALLSGPLLLWFTTRRPLVIGGASSTTLPTPAATPLPEEPTAETGPGLVHLLPQMGPLLLWLALIGALLAVLFALRRSWGSTRTSAAEYETLEGEGALSLLQQVARRLWEEAAARLGPRRLEQQLAAQRIRRVYAALLDQAAQAGAPRPAALTPAEYQPTLSRLFPAAQPELALITEAYQRVRYGELPETLAEVQAVEDAYRRVVGEQRWAHHAGEN